MVDLGLSHVLGLQLSVLVGELTIKVLVEYSDHGVCNIMGNAKNDDKAGNKKP